MKAIVTEKPSVARQFAAALGVSGKGDGCIENNEWIITWCVGHLITLSYPEKYDEELKKWKLDTLPFLPDKYKYEVIGSSAKQYKIVKEILNRKDVDVIYNAGDSGREGEYIQRLVYTAAGVEKKKKILRVWIDSQTDAEILRGIKEAKPEAEYDNLSDAAYMRAIEDYAMGINFSRALTCKFGRKFNSGREKYKPISVGRVMTCVLAMVVEREREIRNFKETPFYKLQADVGAFKAQWKAVEGSAYFESDKLYSETGFKAKEDADALCGEFTASPKLRVTLLEKKNERKLPPLLYNLAELQADCSRIHKISPDDTLEVAQKLYEAKLTTYPRTDARVLTTAVADVIEDNIKGIADGDYHASFASDILKGKTYKDIANSKYVDDSKVTDHYAIIPTGEGSTSSLSDLELAIYHMIIDRFLSLFMPAAIYEKTSVELTHSNGEKFFASASKLVSEGYLAVAGVPEKDENAESIPDQLTQGDTMHSDFAVIEGKTTPPKRYTSGSMILAMENAGKLIEDEELREQIKSCGIGTSATRAGVIKKLTETNGFLKLNKKTQVITPTDDGEAVYDIAAETLPDFLSPKFTASWERGLAQIEQGKIERSAYQDKLNEYIRIRIDEIKDMNNGQVYEGEKTEPVVLGTCPNCGQEIKTGKFGAYCVGKCGMMLSKARGKKLTDDQVRALLDNKSIVIKGLKSKNGNDYALKLTPSGIEDFSYTNKEGKEVSGKQFTFETEFADTKKKKQKPKKS